MTTVFSKFLLTLLWVGCTNKQSENEDSGQSGYQGAPGPNGGNPDDAASDDVETQVLFDVTGVPYDITETPDGVLYVSIAENGIVEWDPEVNWPETLTERAGSIFGIHWYDGDLYYTTSVHRQEGSLSKLNGNEGEVLATAAGDVIFREPTDLTRTSDGAWVLTDKTLQKLLVVRETGTTLYEPGVTEPSSITSDSTHLYIGGSNGVSRIAWPDGTAEKIDERPVNGLHIFQDELLGTNTEWGVFRVGESTRIGFDDMRIPGRLGGSSTLYVTDWANSGVWSNLE